MAHVAAFAFFGGVCLCRSCTTTRRIAVARIMGDGKRRQRTRVFSELVSHYLFEDRFGRPGKGNDKGKVEGMVGYALGVTSWYPSPGSPTLMNSMPIWPNSAAIA